MAVTLRTMGLPLGGSAGVFKAVFGGFVEQDDPSFSASSTSGRGSTQGACSGGDISLVVGCCELDSMSITCWLLGLLLVARLPMDRDFGGLFERLLGLCAW